MPAAPRSSARGSVAFAVCLAGSAGLWAAPAGAASPVHVSFPVQVTYEIPELTELCSVEDWFALEGTFKDVLFRDRAGGVTGEFDSQPNTWQTLYSPTTGSSFSWPFATTFHNEHPVGSTPATGWLRPPLASWRRFRACLPGQAGPFSHTARSSSLKMTSRSWPTASPTLDISRRSTTSTPPTPLSAHV